MTTYLDQELDSQCPDNENSAYSKGSFAKNVRAWEKRRNSPEFDAFFFGKLYKIVFFNI